MTTVIEPRRRTWAHALAGPLKAALRYVKYLIKAAPIMFPRRVECNVCGWQGKRLLSDVWHKHSVCPRCRSGVRHRLLAAALAQIEPLSFEAIVENKCVLHFAPEPTMQDRVRSHAAIYLTADYLNPRRDLQLDISDMHTIGDGDFELLIACDVLEHVEDDRRAMREIHRVLSPGGFAILTVPQKDHLAETFEDPSIVDPAERERVYGQCDHLRIYGDDFQTRLEQAGFEVIPVSERDFPTAQVQRHVLFPPELSTHPLATNYRKVYFAHRPAA